MDINDKSVLEKLNQVIQTDRLNSLQILHMSKLVSISKNISELKDNINWEAIKTNK